MQPGPAPNSDLVDSAKTSCITSLPEPHHQVISETGLKALAQRCVAAQIEDGPGIAIHSTLLHPLPDVHAADENLRGDDRGVVSESPGASHDPSVASEVAPEPTL